jgi:hypothetical protein
MCRRFLFWYANEAKASQPQLATPCAWLQSCAYKDAPSAIPSPLFHSKLILFLRICCCVIVRFIIITITTVHIVLQKYQFFWSRCCFPNKHIYGHVCLPPMCSPCTEESETNTLDCWVVILRRWLEASYIYKPDTCAVWIPEMFGFFCDAERFVRKLCLSLQNIWHVWEGIDAHIFFCPPVRLSLSAESTSHSAVFLFHNESANSTYFQPWFFR